jgi:hypothetical protein
VRLRKSEGSRQIYRTKTESSGVAGLSDITPGRYDLVAVIPGSGYAVKSAVDIMAGTATPAIELQFKPGGTLRIVALSVKDGAPATPASAATGVSAVGNTRPVGGALIVFQQGGDVNASSMNEDMALYGYDSRRFITRDGDGVYELADLVPGRYKVGVKWKGVEDVDVRSIDISEGKTEVATFTSTGVTGAAIEVQLKNKKGEPVADTDFVINMTGPGGPQGRPAIVQGGAPPPADGLAIDLLSNRPSNNQMRRARTNSEGNVVLFPVDAGKWRITARRAVGDNPVPTRGGKAIAPIEVNATDAGASIVVTVED